MKPSTKHPFLSRKAHRFSKKDDLTLRAALLWEDLKDTAAHWRENPKTVGTAVYGLGVVGAGALAGAVDMILPGYAHAAQAPQHHPEQVLSSDQLAETSIWLNDYVTIDKEKGIGLVIKSDAQNLADFGPSHKRQGITEFNGTRDEQSTVNDAAALLNRFLNVSSSGSSAMDEDGARYPSNIEVRDSYVATVVAADGDGNLTLEDLNGKLRPLYEMGSVGDKLTLATRAVTGDQDFNPHVVSPGDVLYLGKGTSLDTQFRGLLDAAVDLYAQDLRAQLKNSSDAEKAQLQGQLDALKGTVDDLKGQLEQSNGFIDTLVDMYNFTRPEAELIVNGEGQIGYAGIVHLGDIEIGAGRFGAKTIESYGPHTSIDREPHPVLPVAGVSQLTSSGETNLTDGYKFSLGLAVGHGVTPRLIFTGGHERSTSTQHSETWDENTTTGVRTGYDSNILQLSSDSRFAGPGLEVKVQLSNNLSAHAGAVWHPAWTFMNTDFENRGVTFTAGLGLGFGKVERSDYNTKD